MYLRTVCIIDMYLSMYESTFVVDSLLYEYVGLVIIYSGATRATRRP